MSEHAGQMSANVQAFAVLQALCLLEQRLCQPLLSSLHGDCGLWLRPQWAPPARPPALLHRMLELRLDGARLVGPVVGLAESLPIRSASQSLVVLQHATDVLEAPEALVDEACRVLLPEGLLLLVGMNPLSPAAWRLQLRARRSGVLVELPRHPAAWWRRRLSGHAFEALLLRQLGPVLGFGSAEDEAAEPRLRSHPLCCVSVLLARRRLLRPVPRRARLRPAQAAWSPAWTAGRCPARPRTASPVAPSSLACIGRVRTLAMRGLPAIRRAIEGTSSA